MGKVYIGVSDEELVERYRAGDKNACAILINRYKDMVRKKTKAMFLVGGDSDDLIQEGMIGLYEAIGGYSNDKGANFKTFASMCINRQMCTAVRLANSKKNSPLNTYISFDTPIQSSEENEYEDMVLMDVLATKNIQNPEEIVIDQDFIKDIRKKILDVLSPMEEQVLRYRLKGMNYTEIAQIMEKSPKSIDNALQRIKGKIFNLLS